MNKVFSLVIVVLVLIAALAACTTAPAAAPTQAPAAAATTAPAQPPAAAGPADIKGMKACYLIPSLSNTFLNNLATSVKNKAAADGVEVFVYGAEEGGATAQYSQIENCISQGINAMIVMAPGSIENVLPAVQEAQKAGIKVIGVPPGELEPFDAIMHTDQLEDGTKIAEMACNFINATYPDAPDKGVDVAIIGNESGEKQMNLRYQGMRTITKNCPKANLVQAIDTSVEGIAAAASTAENILTANPNVKVFLVSSSAQAQGVAQTIKALPNVDVSQYGVYAGDMDPTMIETVKSCKDPYKGLVAIGGTNLDQTTYDLLKKVLQGVEYPQITNDVLEPIFCESAAPAAAAPADIKGMKVCYLLPTLANTFLNQLANSVKAKAAADGVEVFVYGAEEGGATAQYSQIENCISMGVKGMIVMAPGSIENVIPAVEEAKKAGIKVIGVPPGDLEPFDAIMHTDQKEDGTLVAKMACDFINKTYPDAPAKGVEVVVMGSESGEKQMNLRYQGYRTIADCPKANVVQYVDTPQSADSIPGGASLAENALAANPNVKVFIMQSSAQAQGAAQTIKALPGVDVSKYAVFAGDMDPSQIEIIKSCKDPYKGLVAIGGTDLDQATYDLLKKVLQGVEYPKITNDRLEPIFCELK